MCKLYSWTMFGNEAGNSGNGRIMKNFSSVSLALYALWIMMKMNEAGHNYYENAQLSSLTLK